ncbi:MAG: metal-dependent transcriptional regulator [Phycisphaeraceae bacterium]|nr:metal-dependent transcriptional regulator [Phycisphaeraceae bacterium]
MATQTVEDYLKQILHQEQLAGAARDWRLSTGELAVAMSVTPGTATSMAKTLSEAGLVDYEARQGLRLTARGRKLAMHVLRRHRILELFLVQVVGLDWSEVHVEAERLEHAVSERVLEKLDALLGHPGFDPHGSPIPTAAGQLAPSRDQPLSRVEVGRSVRVGRVADQSPQFLNYLSEQGLVPGATVQIVDHDPQAQVLRLRASDGASGRAQITLSVAAAEKIFIRPASADGG